MGVFKRHTLSTTDGETKHEGENEKHVLCWNAIAENRETKKEEENHLKTEEKTKEERIKFAFFNTRFQHKHVVIKSAFSRISSFFKIESPDLVDKLVKITSYRE